jgi:hypothetical protein
MDINEDIKDLEKEELELSHQVKALDKKITVFNYIGWIAIILGVILGIVGVIYLLNKQGLDDLKLNELGDFLGGTVASMWSLAGLFFIYVAFLGQQKQMLLQNLEIKISRLELKATRAELEGQKEQMIIQNQTSIQQAFENTFFSLLQSQREIIKSLSGHVYVPSGELHGRDYHSEGKEYIDNVVKVINYYIFRMKFNIETVDKEAHEKFVLEQYELIVKNKQSELGHYFRHLYHIIKYIDKSEVVDKEKYIDLVQAQMSDEELVITFYNGLSKYGVKNFYPLLDKYSFLENIQNRGEVFKFHTQIFYPNTKFKINRD